MIKAIKKTMSIAKQHGFLVLFKRLFKALPSRISKLSRFFNTILKYRQIEVQIIDIINKSKYKMVDIQHFSFGWEVSLFQRPQHMARNLARKQLLVFYGMHHSEYDDKNYPINKIEGNLYSIDLDNSVVFNILRKALKSVNMPKYYHVYSTNDNYLITDLIRLSSDFEIIYEYIDSISLSKDNQIKTRHEQIIKMKNIRIVVTSKELLDEIEDTKISSCALISNGVDFSHWDDHKDQKRLEIFEKIRESHRFIIGYYGALTQDWFDFELIEKISEIDHFHIVLIGPLNYRGPSNKSSDSHFERLFKKTNVTLLDSVSYMDLPNYARYFDVAIIPFLENEITKATSPVKLFEYMALGKPIVTTYLPECQQFSVVNVTTNHHDFIDALKNLYSKPIDTSFAMQLKEEAKRNTWEQRADQMIEFMLD